MSSKLEEKRQKAGSPRSRFDFTVWIQLQDSWLDVSTTHSRNPQISTVLVSAPAGTHSTAHYLALGEMQISYNLSTREGGRVKWLFGRPVLCHDAKQRSSGIQEQEVQGVSCTEYFEGHDDIF